LKKYGRLWKSQSEELKEANKYINKVNSYCYHFNDFNKNKPVTLEE